MKVIIAGSRHIKDYACVKQAIKESGFKITEVVCGGCRGVDMLGKRWGFRNDIPVKLIKADWTKYKLAAGPMRNREMAKYGEALIAIWDGFSDGTKNMIFEARIRGRKIHIHKVEKALIPRSVGSES